MTLVPRRASLARASTQRPTTLERRSLGRAAPRPTVTVIRPGRRERLGLPRAADALGCALRWAPVEGALGPQAGTAGGELAPDRFDAADVLERLAALSEGSAGVTAGHAYPGMCLASQVARRLGLPGPPPAAVLIAEHKVHARRAMAHWVPEATPRFAWLDPEAVRGAPAGDRATWLAPLPFPFFLKPIKSSFSAGACRIDSAAELRSALVAARGRRSDYRRPLEAWLRSHTALEPCARGLVAEELLVGHQVSIEGRVSGGLVEVLGILDATFHGESLAFESFVYPSRLPQQVQDRMHALAERLLTGLGYDHAPWNLEMRWDEATDRITIVELNAKLASQFVDLFEWVDGLSGWEVLLRTALGWPLPQDRRGRYGIAGSFPLRRFADAEVLAVPSPERVATLEAEGGLAIEVLVAPGERLSTSGGLQDGCSFRYAVVNLAAADREDLERRLARVEAALDFRFGAVRSRRASGEAERAVSR